MRSSRHMIGMLGVALAAAHAQAVVQEVNTKPVVRKVRKIGRNERCPCESGEKYKHCCLARSGGAQHGT